MNDLPEAARQYHPGKRGLQNRFASCVLNPPQPGFFAGLCRSEILQPEIDGEMVQVGEARTSRLGRCRDVIALRSPSGGH